MRTPTDWKIIRCGKAGWHADGLSNSGDRVSSSNGTLEGYALESEDGTPVYDASEADWDTFATFVVGGPMVSPKLDKGEVSKFGKADKRTAFGMFPGLSHGYQTIIVATLSGLCSLDEVAVDVYLQALREQVPGVKFGVVKAGKVIWESP